MGRTWRQKAESRVSSSACRATFQRMSPCLALFRTCVSGSMCCNATFHVSRFSLPEVGGVNVEGGDAQKSLVRRGPWLVHFCEVDGRTDKLIGTNRVGPDRTGLGPTGLDRTGQTDGRTDGWTEGRAEGKTGGRTDGRMDTPCSCVGENRCYVGPLSSSVVPRTGLHLMVSELMAPPPPPPPPTKSNEFLAIRTSRVDS